MWFKDKSKKFLLDTSSIIDGRLPVMFRNGLLDGKIVLMDFVLKELQTLADSKQYPTSKKGKAGFAALNEFRNVLEKAGLKIAMCDSNFKCLEVDDKLLAACKADSLFVLVTVDGNLTQVAKGHGVKVLNPNILVNQLRRSAIVGERYVVKLSEPGKQAGQAIGFLPNGAMAVVNGGAAYMHKPVPVIVKNILMTDNGPIVFADLAWERKP